MFEEIQKIIFPNQLSSFEYTRINDLLNTYTEEQILDVYRRVGNKPINYIEKVLKSKKKVPSWLYKEIQSQELDKETIDINNDFKSFIEEFRNEIV